MTITTLMTADELLYVPDDGMQRELIDGVLITMSPDNPKHGSVASNLHVPLALYVRRNDLGRIWDNVGFILKRDPDTVLAPDVAFVPADRVLHADDYGFFRGYPELAVEILSPSNTVAEMQRKTRLYLESGVRLVWIVNSVNRKVAVHVPDQPVQLVHDGETLDGGNVLPGFAIAVAEIFA